MQYSLYVIELILPAEIYSHIQPGLSLAALHVSVVLLFPAVQSECTAVTTCGIPPSDWMCSGLRGACS